MKLAFLALDAFGRIYVYYVSGGAMLYCSEQLEHCIIIIVMCSMNSLSGTGPLSEETRLLATAWRLPFGEAVRLQHKRKVSATSDVSWTEGCDR